MTVATTLTPDFTGYATRFDRVCTDGRTIKHSAFVHQDKLQVPLVWQHQHDNPENVLGHAILHQRADGVYTEAFFNETDRGQHAKQLVLHGDIKALSIFANRLRQTGGDVVHGTIIEVSLVYKGANPDAFIEDVNLRHSGDGSDDMVGEAIIYPGEEFSLYHADSDDSEETVQDVFDSLTPKQKDLFYAIATDAANGSEGDVKHGEETSDDSQESEEDESENTDSTNSEDETSDDSKESEEEQSDVDSDTTDSEKLQHNTEGSDMTYNVFKSDTAEGNGTAVAQRKTLSHADLVDINHAARELGSYKKAVEGFLLQHADYGIENIDILFPDARVSSNTPELIARQTEWVAKVLGATKHSPFAKVKTILADLTAEEARAKGYVKGTLKKDEVVTLLQRTTSPTTIYKKQKLDRDDILDITDIDIVAWLKWEIRFMLNEEIARAILIGDGRTVNHADKIKDPAGQIDGIGIRSVAKDHELYAHAVQLAANVAPSVMIDDITRARTNYRGSGSPTFYTTDSVLTELLLLKDKMGRRLYETEAALAAAIRVKEIVPVEVMEEDPTLIGIIVNLIDYTVGTNKGGEVTMFDDFDIDFNQYKYLMETRLSGALTKPKSALVIRREQGTEVTATAPSFNSATNTITIPTKAGVEYLINGEVVAAGNVVIDETTDVEAEPITGYYLAPLSTRHWSFTYTAG